MVLKSQIPSDWIPNGVRSVEYLPESNPKEAFHAEWNTSPNRNPNGRESLTRHYPFPTGAQKETCY